MGIEPTSSAWEADILPMNYTRLLETLYHKILFLARVDCIFCSLFVITIKELTTNLAQQHTTSHHRTA